MHNLSQTKFIFTVQIKTLVNTQQNLWKKTYSSYYQAGICYITSELYYPIKSISRKPRNLFL